MKRQLLVLFAMFFVVTGAWAAILQVGTSYPYSNVQSALAVAVNGDEIHVMTPGTYNGFSFNSTGTIAVKNMSAGVVDFYPATNAPTITVAAGKLILRGCLVHESPAINTSAILVTGGELDAGISSDHGLNTFQVMGSGKGITNSGGVANAIGNHWGSTDYYLVNSFVGGTVAFDPWCNYGFTQCNFSTSGGPVTTIPDVIACSPFAYVPIHVSSFANVDAISLTLNYDPAILGFVGFTSNPNFPGLYANSPVPGTIIIGWFGLGTPVTLPGPQDLLTTLQFTYTGGYSAISFNDTDPTWCEYSNFLINGPYNDQPFSNFYDNGTVTELTAPIAGPDVTECQQIPTQTLTATATPVAPGNSIVWYDAQTGGNVVSSPTLSAPGTVTYWAANTNGTCISVGRVPVTLHMDPINLASIYYDNGMGYPEFCSNGTVANVIHSGTLNGTYSAAPAGLTINPTTGQVDITTSTPGSYTVSYYMAPVGQCPGVTATTSITITQLPSITTFNYPGTPFCFDGPSVMPNLVASNMNGYFMLVSPISGLALNPSSGQITMGGLSQANTYNVQYTIPAAFGCPDVSMVTQLTVLPELQLSLVPQHVTCFGYNNGTATVYATGGAGGYQYLWNDPAGQTTATATALYAGAYSVTVTDANGCTATGSVIVTEPTKVTATITSYSHITCFGFNNGTATVYATGGTVTSGYSYYWTPSGQTTATAVNLGPGTHSVAVYDDYMCLATASVTLTEPAEVLPPTNPGHITVCGTLPVTQTITATATVPAGHSIVWYNMPTGGSVVSSPTLSTVGSVTYYAEAVNNTTQCSSLSRLPVNLQIDQPSSAVIAYLGDPYCSIDGIATVTRTGTPGGYPGGTPGGTYFAFQPGIVINPATGDIDLAASVPGTYTIGYVMPANGTCPSTITTAPITIELYPNASISYTTPFCYAAGVQMPTITGTQGGLFSYFQYPLLSLNTVTGAINLQGASNPGTYTVFYSFAATVACPQYNTSTQVVVLPPMQVVTNQITRESCFGANDGAIDITVTSTNLPLNYVWTGPTTIGNVEDPIGLAPGIYSVTVTDFYGCTATETFTVPGPAQLGGTVSYTNVTCNGANDGTITVSNPVGGWGTYEYTVNGGMAWYATPLFTNLAPGTYNVMIRDAANPWCIEDLDGVNNTAVTEPMPVTATFTYVNINCYNAANGSITFANPAGGYGTYEFSIDGILWQTGLVFSNLTPGVYIPMVRDAAFTYCVTSLGQIVITQPAMLSAYPSKINVSCFGANDGVIYIQNPTGGFGTYEYTIDGGLTWQSGTQFFGLIPGTYDVQIRDAAVTWCVIDLDGVSNTVITEPAKLTATVTPTNITCNGAGDGKIDITNPAGGYGSYEFSIDGGLNWNTAMNYSNLAAGNYQVQIRDVVYTYCLETLANVTITDPAMVTATVVVTNVSCYGANDGIITLANPTGGWGTYEFSKDGGLNWQTSNVFTGLVPGTYDMWIRDAVNTYCKADLDGVGVTTTVTEPQPLQSSISSPVYIGGTNVSCYNGADGSINTTVIGGTMPYQYSWTGPVAIGNVANPANLPAGTYQVVIVDAHGCTQTTSIVLTQPYPIGIMGSSSNVSCPGGSDGMLGIYVMGGTPNYSYSWSGPSAIGNVDHATGLLAGLYSVVVTDANGCTETYSITVQTTPDLTPPSFVCPQPVSVYNNPGYCYATVSNPVPVAYDKCDPAPVVIGVRSDMLALVDPYPVGTTTVIWTAYDINGNSSTCSQIVVVTDIEVPAITCPQNINTVYQPGACSAQVNVGTPVVSDNCAVLSVTGVRSDLLPLTDPYPAGITTITWTVTDIHFNVNSCVQTVTVTPTELLMLYNFNYASLYPIMPDFIAPFLTGYCTSFEPFLLTPTGTTTGNQAFVSDINLANNNGLATAMSNGNNVRYFEFRVAGDSLYKYRDYKLYLQGRRQAQAATQIAAYYSFDNITYYPGDSMQLSIADTWFQGIINLSTLDTINYSKNLYLRLYMKGTNVVSGQTRLDIDNFQLTAVNGPLARPDFATVQKNGTVVIDVLANDYYGCNGQASPIPIIGVDVALNGTSTQNPNGTFTYTPDPNYLGPDFFTYKICDGLGKCDTAIVRVNVVTDDLYLIGKVFLQGAYNTATGLMNDNLRSLNYLPTTEPYSAAPYNVSFTHYGLGGGETVNPAVFNVTGNNAIVDWVFVELRDKNNASQVVATRSALVQSDGDIVDVDGVSPVKFSSLPDNTYFVAVRHRNHLGVMGANTFVLTNSGTVVNFTNGSVPEYNIGIQNNINYATLAQKDLNPGVRGLHAGNAANDHKVKYQGVNSDRTRILNELLTFPGNTLYEFNYNFAVGYFSGDIDMDGQVKYSGPNSDRNYLLSLILNYVPGTTSVFDFFIEQLP